MILRTAIFAVCLAALLGGCGNDPRRFSVASSTGISRDAGLGTVVIGQLYVGRGETRESCPQRLAANWVRLRAATDPAGAPIFSQPSLRDFGCAIDDKSVPPAFSVFQLEPGDYVLTHITDSGFMRGQGSTVVRNDPEARDPDGRPARTVPRFRVAAGEIVYVGNLVYLNSFPAEIKGESTPDLARAALRALWPDGAERMIERRMLIGPEDRPR